MEIKYKLTHKQTQAYEYLTNENDLALLFGGAKGGGKSYFLSIWVMCQIYNLIKLFGLKNMKHPLALGFIGRKRGVDFNDTTFETFKRVVPSHLYEIKWQEKEIIFENKAKILFGGLDDEQHINKFNSAEFAFIAIDQAEETTREDIAILQATLRLQYNGIKPPYKELYTANPAECWLKEDFINHNREKGIFVPALPDDNPYLPMDYKETLRNAFSYDPKLLRAYLEGDWDAFTSLQNNLVLAKWIEQCRKNYLPDSEEDNVIIAADVATKHGDCQTIIIVRKGHIINKIIPHSKIPATMTAQIIKKEYEINKGDTIVIDSDGFGEGVSDILENQKIGVLEFHGGYGYKAMDATKFKNLRSQFYWIVAKKLEKGLYDLSRLSQIDYEKLKQQLCLIQVRPPDMLGRIQIETKDDMMARKVQSPDYADALVYSEYGFWMGKMGDIKPYCYR